MNHIILIVFGLAPSLIWLSYYLRKDTHPEPKSMILKIFICGAIVTAPVAFLEMLFQGGFDLVAEISNIYPSPTQISSLFRYGILQVSELSSSSLLFFLLYSLIAVAFIEEFFKYLVVRCKVLNDSEFDEPIDTMIYMIIAGLGFAALENILYLHPHLFPIIKFSETCQITTIRFLGAVFLHALCSATIGFFLALSICRGKYKLLYLSTGFIFASILHGLFNYSIIILEGDLKFYITTLILLSLALFVSWAFVELKKMKSMCVL